MNRLKPWVTSAAVWLAASTGASAATIVASPCNDCTTAQFKQAALGASIGIHYFYDFSNGVLKKYNVTRKCDIQPGGCRDIAVADTVDQDYLDYFADLQSVHDFFGSAWITYHENVDPNGPLGTYDAYAVVNNRYIQTNISDWLFNNFYQVGENDPGGDLMSTIMGLFQAADKVVTDGQLLTIDIVVVFPDGSKAIFEMSHDSMYGGHAEYKHGSARDMNNNTIPETAGQVPGIYSIGGSYGPQDPRPDWQGWRQRLQQLGVSFTGSGAGTWACTIAGGATSCSWSPY